MTNPPENEDIIFPLEYSDPEVVTPLQPAPQQFKVIFPQSTPFVTYGIIALTVIVFLLQVGTQFFLNVDIPAAYGIKYNPYIDSGQFWRLITPVLLHGDIMHIGFNMYAVYILGRGLEQFYGHGRFLLLYLLGGFTGTTLSYLLTANPSLGASTATFGLLLAYGVLGYRNRKVFGQQSQRIVRNVVQVALINIVLGLTPGIDNWGHIGGAIGGALLAWFGGPDLDFKLTGEEVHIEDQRSKSSFLITLSIVFCVFAVLAVVLNGKV
ncbi:MAG: rhomboid family intramembrane serine protease [Anaerolineales bacterium]|nr:rhomboid family intramembrane serine protease [Anaerolineales bacterium]